MLISKKREIIRMKFQNFVILSFQIIYNYHKDIQPFIFQNYQLFSLFPCFYICSICILKQLRKDHGQISNKQCILINPFQAIVPFLCPLKTSEKQRFSDIFKGYRKGTLARNGLRCGTYSNLIVKRCGAYLRPGAYKKKYGI